VGNRPLNQQRMMTSIYSSNPSVTLFINLSRHSGLNQPGYTGTHKLQFCVPIFRYRYIGSVFPYSNNNCVPLPVFRAKEGLAAITVKTIGTTARSSPVPRCLIRYYTSAPQILEKGGIHPYLHEVRNSAVYYSLLYST